MLIYTKSLQLFSAILLSYFLICASSEKTFAQTNWGGIISSNTTLTADQSPYIIQTNTLVMENVTLTIEPGTVLQFDDSILMQVNGTIRAIGTETDSIVFTRIPGSITGWGGLRFHHLSTPYDSLTGEGCVLAYMQLKHVASLMVSNTQTYPLFINNASPLIEHSEISCFKSQIYFWRSSAIMRHCSIHDASNELSIMIEDPLNLNHLVMDHCYIHNMNAPASNLTSSRIMSLGANCTVRNCYFGTTNTQITMALYGNGIELTGNTFENGENIAIGIFGGWQPSVHITGNRFSGNRINLLLSACERHPLISENDFMDFSEYNVLVSQYYYPFTNSDCAAIDSYYVMDLQNNYWSGLTESEIAGSIHDFNDNFLEQVAVDYDGFASAAFELNDITAAEMTDRINCLATDGLYENTLNRLNVWPNPVTGKSFSMHLDRSEEYKVYLYSSEGQLVQSSIIPKSDETFAEVAIEQLPVGCYYMKLVSSGSHWYTALVTVIR